MFRKAEKHFVPTPPSQVEHREWTVFTFRKREFKKLTGIGADRHGVAGVDVTGGPNATVKIRMYGDQVGRGSQRASAARTYTLGMADFKSRLGIADPRDVLLVSTGGALSNKIEITMSRRAGDEG